MTKARPKGHTSTKSSDITRPSTMKPIGILGGGQLARMLALKAHEMGLRVLILSENDDDPAAQVADWMQGDFKNPKHLKTFLSKCSLATFESEFLDAEVLESLSKSTGVPIFPRPRDMALIQDRLTQKELLLTHGLPTARFFSVATEAEARAAFADLGGAAVFKKRRFGYDGYGTFVVRTAAELQKFLPELARNPHGFIAEELISFKREVAVMVARSSRGEVSRFPFVETFQQNSRCLWVKGPLAPSPALAALAKKLDRFLAAASYVGIMGVELFETSRSGYVINELAPRVHNSGHYSLDALKLDQFSAHLRAITGASLPAKPELLSPAFAMWNLIGSSAHEPSWKTPSDVHLHWYGKLENRPGRKMGHVNAVGATSTAALNLLKKRRADFNV